MRRVFGIFEVVFDILYLVTALILGMVLLLTKNTGNIQTIGGIMALTLAFGDSFHLIPRIRVIISGNEEALRPALGRGKQITSITMTIFYLLLLHIGLLLFNIDNPILLTFVVYALAISRIMLCLHPNNKWKEREMPLNWSIWRNTPFFIMAIFISSLFFINRNVAQGFSNMWLAIIFSFAFYLPVVLWSNINPKIGMLMLPKTCMYLWMLFMFLSLN